jgi:hypothetical protein
MPVISLDNPLVYMVCSAILAAVIVLYLSFLAESRSVFQTMTIIPLFPLASLILLNFVLSLFLSTYFILRYVFFGLPFNSVVPERQQIMDKLFVFFSVKLVLIGLVVETGFSDVVFWVLWCAPLAIVKAITNNAISRADYLASSG